MHRRHEMLFQPLVFRPHFSRRQLPKIYLREQRRPAMPQIRREKIHLRPPQMIAPNRIIGDLLQLPRQRPVLQLVQVAELLARKPARAGQPVVVIHRLLRYRHLRVLDHPSLLLLRRRYRAQPPALAPPLDRLPHPPVRHRQKNYPPLGNPRLQQFIRGEGQIHPGRIRPDHHRVRVENQIYRVAADLFLFLQTQRPQPLLAPPLVDRLNECRALPRVNIGRQRIERLVVQKQGADPRFQPSLFIPFERRRANQFQFHAHPLILPARPDPCKPSGKRGAAIISDFWERDRPGCIRRRLADGIFPPKPPRFLVGRAVLCPPSESSGGFCPPPPFTAGVAPSRAAPIPPPAAPAPSPPAAPGPPGPPATATAAADAAARAP